jgi:RNA polymerase sigma-70 factor, ECF subfamily
VHEVAVEALFVAFRDTGDADALAAVFDRLAPKLLLVAAHLAGGDVAEDLVQATFLDAMRQRQRWNATRLLAPWLIGLLGNHVREVRRQRRRVPDPQRLAARTIEPPANEVEAAECFAAVAAAVAALPRHYRQVLSLRLVHGLELQQIAHSLDVPLGTVKVRLHRGLALLRRALPAGLTATFAMLATPSLGLTSARAHVLQHAATISTGSVVGAASLVLGGWVMKKWLLGAAIAAVAGIGWFALDPMGHGATTATVPEPPVVVVRAAAGLAPPDPAPAASPAPTTPAAGSGDANQHQRTEAATTGSVVVHAVWEDEVPAPFVTLRAYRKRVPKSPTAATGSDGRARFENLTPGDYMMLAEHAKQDSKASHGDVRAGETSSLKIVLGGDLRLRITVVDVDGAPRRGAEVWAEDSWAQTEVYRSIGSTNELGELSWRGLPVEQVYARCSGHEPTRTHALPRFAAAEVPREPIAVRLMLGPRSCTVTGTVVDPQGRPAANARIAIACDDTISPTRPELLVHADGQGRFQCDEVPSGARTIAASLPELAPATQRITTSPNEPTNVLLQLRTGVTLAGRVVDAVGKPIADAVVYTRGGDITLGLQSPYGQYVVGRTDQEGRYELRAIAPGSFSASVQIEPEIKRAFTAADGERLTWDPMREQERAIVGAVVDGDDKPLAQWRVTALPPPSVRLGFTPHDHVTDAQGRFRIPSLTDAAYRVFVFGPRGEGDRFHSAANDVSALIVEDVRPTNESRTFRVPADAMPTAWIEGSLALPDDLRAKAELSLYPKTMQGRGGFMVPQERLEPGVTTFRIGPLPPGLYDLLCDIEGRGRLSHRDLRLVANETLRLRPFAFDTQRPQIIVLRHADGRVASGGTMRFESSHMPCKETAPGRYESPPLDAGPDEIGVRGPDFAPAKFPVARNTTSTPIELTVAAATKAVVRLTPSTPRDRWIGALTIRVTDANGTVLVDEMTQLDGGADFRVPIGLAPGMYSLSFAVYGDGKANTTAVVGTEPLQIDLQITK